MRHISHCYKSLQNICAQRFQASRLWQIRNLQSANVTSTFPKGYGCGRGFSPSNLRFSHPRPLPLCRHHVVPTAETPRRYAIKAVPLRRVCQVVTPSRLRLQAKAAPRSGTCPLSTAPTIVVALPPGDFATANWHRSRVFVPNAFLGNTCLPPNNTNTCLLPDNINACPPLTISPCTP